MNFRGYNFHQSSGIERFASNLSAIEYINFFRKKHRRLFRIIITVIIVSIAVFAILLIAGKITQGSAKNTPQGNTEQTTNNVQVHSYEVLSEHDTAIYVTLPEDDPLLQLTISYFDHSGNFVIAYDHQWQNVPKGFQRMILQMPDLSFYDYDLYIQVTG